MIVAGQPAGDFIGLQILHLFVVSAVRIHRPVHLLERLEMEGGFACRLQLSIEQIDVNRVVHEYQPQRHPERLALPVAHQHRYFSLHSASAISIVRFSKNTRIVNAQQYVARALRAAGRATMPPHVAELGRRFYTGTQFPAEFRGNIFIAEHGSWNRSRKIGYRVVRVVVEGRKAVKHEVFAQGWLQAESAWGGRATSISFPTALCSYPMTAQTRFTASPIPEKIDLRVPAQAANL